MSEGLTKKTYYKLCRVQNTYILIGNKTFYKNNYLKNKNCFKLF